MSPIRHMTRREWLFAFWAVVAVSVVVSTGALIAASSANNTASRAEKGFCLSLNLVEKSAVADDAIANNPTTTDATSEIRKGTAKASLTFSSELRKVVHCSEPPPAVSLLFDKYKINPQTQENK